MERAAAPEPAPEPAPDRPRSAATPACRTWEKGCLTPLTNALVVLHLSVGTASLVMAAMLVSTFSTIVCKTI